MMRKMHPFNNDSEVKDMECENKEEEMATNEDIIIENDDMEYEVWHEWHPTTKEDKRIENVRTRTKEKMCRL